MVFVRYFSELLVWVSILMYYIFIILLGVFCYLEYKDINDYMIECNCEIDPYTESNKTLYLVLMFVAIGIFFLSMIGLFCIFSALRLVNTILIY